MFKFKFQLPNKYDNHLAAN